MENLGVLGLGGVTTTSKKKRSNLNRRPPNQSESPQEYHDGVSLSSTPSDLVSDAPSEGNALQKSSDENELFGENPASDSSKKTEIIENRTSKLVSGSHHFEQPAGNENKFKMVKLKVGGVTHTIQTGFTSDDSSVAGASALATSSDAMYPSHQLDHQKNSNVVGEKGGLSGVPWKDFSRTGFSFQKVRCTRVVHTTEESVKHGRSQKIKSVLERSMPDEIYDEEDDDEIRYLKKLKSSRTTSYNSPEYEDESRVQKLRRLSKVMDRDSHGYEMSMQDSDSSRSGKRSKKSISLRAFEDSDYTQEEESVSYGTIEPRNKKQRKEPTEVPEFSKSESSITTRRKAIQITGHNPPSLGTSLIQYPDGLLPAPPKKQKEQLSEVELQLKRTEAAKRRKMQNEKAALESQAEAIRKILGQDSSRKRREDKIKKRQEELAQERTMNATGAASKVVRWVMGPSGTVVTFPDEIGLPSIFEPKPCSYPPPREKCAGPSCTNAYKYRDSKSNLPLCSLRCYKAVHEKMQPLSAC